ncbi:hypothetical protein [uncultured Methanoregula sp.]|uniref:hypothetical protein n=1 Tax=uncultured Methanoregula sp. TaxID=1005933 RepID=UPI002AAB6E37|nr:hypothetical protein [uncultured Methanoregula sp.]
MKVIDLLDNERREIETRIVIRAAVHHARNKGISLSPPGSVPLNLPDGTTRPMTAGDLENINTHNVYADAYRYVEIENQQWKILGLSDTGKHQQPPI